MSRMLALAALPIVFLACVVDSGTEETTPDEEEEVEIDIESDDEEEVVAAKPVVGEIDVEAFVSSDLDD